MDKKQRKLWQLQGSENPLGMLEMLRGGIAATGYELTRRGTEYRLVQRIETIPRDTVTEIRKRWHLQKGEHELHDVMPYEDMEIAIAQAEAWLKENELV